MSTPYAASIIVSPAGNGQAGVTISPGGLPGPTGPPGPAGAGLTPTAVKTSAYAAAPSDFVPVDTTSGAVTITLPAAPADQTVIGVKMVKQGGTNAVTVAAGGSDRFNITGGASSLSLALLFQGTEVQYDHAAALWYVIADDLSLGSLDGRYTQDAGDLGGTTTSPQVISTHLASPLPLAQGGTGAASAPAALTSLGAASAAALTAETARAEAAEALLAPLASPALTGSPTAPTKAPLTDNTGIATTAYADLAVGVETARAEAAEALLAPLASPALTGSPTAPTKTALTSNTDIATTAYADSAVGVETSRAETAEALLAPKASPALTGTPTVPTAAALTSNTQAASTAYADSAVAAAAPSSGSPLPLLKGGTGLSETTTASLLAALGALQLANNLSDLASRATALNNLAGAVTSGSYLRGNGTNVQMSAIQAADLPAATTSVQGAVVLDGTAGDIQALAASAAAGSKGQAADAKHVHPWTGLALLNDPMQFGVAIDFFPGLLTILATVNTANNGCYTKLTSGGYAFSNLNIDVGVASGNISVAVYTTSGTGMSAAPTGGQLTTSGAVACPASGIATVSLGSSVTPHLGDWVGLSCDNTTATILRAECNTFQGTLFLPGFGSLQASAHPLPSTPSSLTASASVGNFMMRGS